MSVDKRMNNDDILYAPIENHDKAEKQESDNVVLNKFWRAIVDQIHHEIIAITITTTAETSTPFNITWHCDDQAKWVRC